MAKKSKDTASSTENISRDNLSSLIADGLNKQFKNNKVAFFLDGTDDAYVDVNEWVSTGSDLLDLIISNRPNGGLPVGRIVEIQGWEASGKSLMSAHICKSTQKKGGMAVYIDTENAVSTEFFKAIGVDTSKENFLLVQVDCVEDAFQATESIIEIIRKSDKNRLVTIITDSIAAASTKVEMESDYEKDGWSTTKSIVISKAMRKLTNLIGRERVLLVYVNQLRLKLGVSFGDNACVDPITTKIKIRYKS